MHHNPYAQPSATPVGPPAPVIRVASFELTQTALNWVGEAEAAVNHRRSNLAAFVDGFMGHGDLSEPGRIAYAGACASNANVYATLAALAYQEERDAQMPQPNPYAT
ncbi:hypothetical protein [Streptomyces sp. IMTB 1903]|uniref:hypothetical protein n=1 Tax=Streptomyces sp. IMTB 1903 TaxID=1776680 RepID=UPI00075571B6|nr:hypothetical protein [Streptomyces sp. IMTB 1903]